MKACFIGHKHIEKSNELILLLKQTIIELIHKGVTTFLFGSMSEFDDLAWEVVTLLKQDFPFIKRIYVRACFQYISKSYEEMLLKSYEETYFPIKLENAGKYAYVERNYEMINNSTFCIFYYDINYIPPLKPQSKHDLFKKRRNSGTKISYEYALKKKRNIINLCHTKKD